ncbi:MAG: hypothetical protein KDD44_15020, partial [Bdellovibrionales bacterium]|nr:hypothetical protein [Bdellovibrionales bacterium]
MGGGHQLDRARHPPPVLALRCGVHQDLPSPPRERPLLGMVLDVAPADHDDRHLHPLRCLLW